MQSATPARPAEPTRPAGRYRTLPFAPLKHAIDTWLTRRGHDIPGEGVPIPGNGTEPLSSAQLRAYYRAARDGIVGLRVAEDFCEDFGWHARMLWGDAYDQLIPQPRRSTPKTRAGMGHNRQITHCPAGHLYDQANTHITVDKDGGQHRACRTCARTRSRDRKRAARRRAAQRQWEVAA